MEENQQEDISIYIEFFEKRYQKLKRFYEIKEGYKKRSIAIEDIKNKVINNGIELNKHKVITAFWSLKEWLKDYPNELNLCKYCLVNIIKTYDKESLNDFVNGLEETH